MSNLSLQIFAISLAMKCLVCKNVLNYSMDLNILEQNCVRVRSGPEVESSVQSPSLSRHYRNHPTPIQNKSTTILKNCTFTQMQNYKKIN